MGLKPIEYLVLEDGRSPFVEWLDELKDEKARAIIRVRLDRVRLGNLGVHRRVGDGVVELIVDYGPGYRVYFGQHGTELVVLVIGGNKKTQPRDIRLAQQYWRAWKKENA